MNIIKFVLLFAIGYLVCSFVLSFIKGFIKAYFLDKKRKILISWFENKENQEALKQSGVKSFALKENDKVLIQMEFEPENNEQ